MSSLNEAKRKKLQADHALKLKQYEQVADTLRLNLNPADMSKLEAHLERLEAELHGIEDALRRIAETSSPASLVQPSLMPKIQMARERLNSPFPRDVMDGIELLEKLKDPAAIPDLVRLLAHDDNGVMNAAREALVKMDNIAVPELIKELANQNRVIGWQAATALGQIKSKAAFHGLLKAVEDTDNDVRKSALSFLRPFNDITALPAASAALRDEDSNIRVIAVGILAGIGGEAVVSLLVEALQDSDRDVRAVAAGKLGQLGNSKAVQGLAKALRDADFYVRIAAARSLGQIRDPAAFEPLLRLLEDEVNGVREVARDALKQLDLSRPHEFLASTASEAARIENYIAQNNHIALEKLILIQIEQLYQKITSVAFYEARDASLAASKGANKETWDLGFTLYFRVCQPELEGFSSLCWYGQAEHTKYVSSALKRWLEKSPTESTSSLWQYIPALFLTYVAGLVAVKHERWDYLAAALATPITSRIKTDSSFNTILSLIGQCQIGERTARIPVGSQIQKPLRSLFEQFIPSETEFVQLFDVFEFIMTIHSLHTHRDQSVNFLISRVGGPHEHEDRSLVSIAAFLDRGRRLGTNWDVLKAGLFDGQVLNMVNVLTRYQKRLETIKASRNTPKRLPNYLEMYKPQNSS